LFYGLIVPANVVAQSTRIVQQTSEQTQPDINQDEEKSPMEKATGDFSPLIVEPGAKRERKFEEGVEKRREWFRFQRRFPFDEIPAKARENAFAQAEASRQALRQPDMVESWQSIGPRPTTSLFESSVGIVSGRINTVAVSPADPQLILVGGVTGGIWRSIDGGANWTAVSDNQADLAVGSIAFAPSNPNVVYAGMGSPGGSVNDYLGNGVLRSADAGQTWTRVGNAATTPVEERLPDTGVTAKILVHPTNADKVFSRSTLNARFPNQAPLRAVSLFQPTVEQTGVRRCPAVQPIWRFTQPIRRLSMRLFPTACGARRTAARSTGVLQLPTAPTAK
jgi:Ni/Co efflux regulator RcnB